jgi:hypothetical protein
MTIDEAIENLKDAKKKGVKNIILAWWAADMFGREDDETWQNDAAVVDEHMDWSATHDAIVDTIALFGSGNE